MVLNTKHLSHSLTLVGILFVAFFGLIMFSYDKYFQLCISVAAASSYVVWGVVHHILDKDFHISILFEYLAVAILGLTVIFTLVIRA